ncbi:MAG: ABC transporter ATP-binding protein [Anaerolineae bacterium]|nr:ABC transporter ATP-binding protein [Anaerolineae bacterium]
MTAGVDRACTPDEPILVVQHLGVTFDSPDGGLGALDDVSFQMCPSEFVCVVGPSGCGKSTLLRVLAGLLPPTRGQVTLRGEPLNGPNADVGVVFQKPNLMPWRTVLRNIALPLEMQGIDRETARGRAQALIDLVGLGGFGGSRPHELSGGMAQRVAIARALIYDPEILLLDEPFGSLDMLTRERMNLELQRIWQQRRKTVLMVTHDIQEAVFLSDRVMVMSVRPGQITEVVEIDLPHPRSVDVLYDEAFLSYMRRIRKAIGTDQ